jgi:hypothetical protein
MWPALLLVAGCDSGRPPDGVLPEEAGAAREELVASGKDGNGLPAPRSGRWRRVRDGSAEREPSLREQIEKLEAIGYVDGSQPAPGRTGVVVHDRERAYTGLNFYVSGHAPEAVLMDMDGAVLHRWHHEFLESFPDLASRAGKPDAAFWRRAHLLENGDILAIHEGLGMIRLDRESRLIWARPHPVHHDFRVLPNGEIVALTRVAHVNPLVSERAPILEDYVSFLDPDGNERRRISLLESYEKAAGDHDWRAAARTFWQKERSRRLAYNPGDLFHTNAVRVLDGRLAERLPAFAAGNLLLSMCHLDAIAIVDPRKERVVWSLDGIFALQHDPTILADGHLMVFDNNWRQHRSRVVVLDPSDGETVWEYGVANDQAFHSRTCGTAAELPNGNLLITSSDSGRAFEITRDSEIVWEFYNPHRAGERDEYIATLFELVRLADDFPTGWLPR